MGEALSTDNKVANMPNIRVLPRAHNIDKIPIEQHKNLLQNAKPNYETDHNGMGIPEFKTNTNSGRKPKIDYAVMLQKV